MKKVLKVLVVEDRKEFVIAAKTYFKGQTDVEASFVSSYEEAKSLIASNSFDRALIDVFMPAPPEATAEIMGKLESLLAEEASEEFDQKYVRKYGLENLQQIREEKVNYLSQGLEAIKKDLAEEAPVGVLLAGLLAEKSGKKKIMMVSSLWHHAEKFEMVHKLFIKEDLACHEGYDGGEGRILKKNYHNKANPEFWKKAYDYLLYKMDEGEYPY